MKTISLIGLFLSVFIACGPEAAGTGTPSPSPMPTASDAQSKGDVVVRWDPPAGYAQVGSVTIEGEYHGFANPWKSSLCKMSVNGPGYVCRLNVSSGTKILFGVKRADSRPDTGSAWVFDRSCDGPWAGCGKDFGAVSVWKNGQLAPYDLVWNGTGPKPPAAVFFTGVVTIP
ncbi:MAG: hypothetical protein AAB879_00850 [Patescibacteria group bacterium]